MQFPDKRRQQQQKWLKGLAFGLVVLCCAEAFANVSVTEPTGGNDISTDKSLNSTNGAGFTALGSIVLTEGANADFAKGTNKTLILTVPGGWQFSTAGGGSVTFTGSRDITAASLSVAASTVTLTLTVAGTTHLDPLTISGLQVQPLDGAGD